MDGLAPGRFVVYVLSAPDCAQINRRRTTGEAIAVKVRSGTWPLGAMAHVGSEVTEGDHLPAQVIRVLDQETGQVNLKVNLDGSDQFWAREVYFTADALPGSWHWPPKV